MAADVDVSDPMLPRRRKVPRRLEEGNVPLKYHSTPKDMHRQVYHEALDILVQASINLATGFMLAWKH